MMFAKAVLTSCLLVASSNAFVANQPSRVSHVALSESSALGADMEKAIRKQVCSRDSHGLALSGSPPRSVTVVPPVNMDPRTGPTVFHLFRSPLYLPFTCHHQQLNYKPGGADTELAKRYGNLVGAQIKTVGEAFAEFTRDLGYTVNPLYKNMVTDLVGTTHLIAVNARFKRDPVWSLGLMSVLELFLKNYPEQEVSDKIISSLIKSVGMDEAEIRKEAEQMKSWVEGKSKADIEAALQGEGDSVLADVAKNIKADKYWSYSRYFGIGLVKVMELVGVEQDKDTAYNVMEDWMSNKLGVSHLTACVSPRRRLRRSISERRLSKSSLTIYTFFSFRRTE